MNDQDLLDAILASPNFTVVRDGDHLADLLGLASTVEAPGEEPGPDAHSVSF